MALEHERMQTVVDRLAPGSTKSAKIRALAEAGYSRSEIARFLAIRPQQVRNALVQARPRREALGAASREMSSDLPDGIRNRIKLKVGPEGRVLIPASIRTAMGAEEGGQLLAWLEHGELRLVSPKIAMRRAQELVRELIPGDDSLADELIADRRREAAEELKDG
jgi:bifunctional DNA-binding transcriptional regulator/antitoxin component of YhaV-PrlF toxin-antitoxin module